MTDDQLIRTLIWQNGLYRGLLSVVNKALGGEIDSDECKRLSAEVDRIMLQPLPPFLVEDGAAQCGPGDQPQF